MRPALAALLLLPAACASEPRRTSRTGEIEESILLGLDWLARHQSADGSWNPERFVSRCRAPQCSPDRGNEETADGVVGLALLAFLETGHGPASLRFGIVVRRGVQALLARQESDGGVGDQAAPKFMYGHSIAVRALSRAWALTKEERLKAAAQRALDFMLRLRRADGGWRYGTLQDGSDSSITGWCVLAVRTAERCGLSVPPGAYDAPNRWFDSVTTRNHDVGYTSINTAGRVLFGGDSVWWNDHDTLVALALLLKSFSGRELDPERKSGFVARLSADLPAWEDYKVDFVYWYCGTLAMGESAAWREAVQGALMVNQNRISHVCRHGAWSPANERWEWGGGGPLYTTATAILTLHASLVRE